MCGVAITESKPRQRLARSGRLGLENVEGGAGDLARFDCPCQRGPVDHFTAGTVHYAHAGLHAGQRGIARSSDASPVVRATCRVM